MPIGMPHRVEDWFAKKGWENAFDIAMIIIGLAILPLTAVALCLLLK